MILTSFTIKPQITRYPAMVLPNIPWYETNDFIEKPTMMKDIIVSGLGNYFSITSLCITARIFNKNRFIQQITEPYMNLAEKLILNNNFYMKTMMASMIIIVLLSSTRVLGKEK